MFPPARPLVAHLFKTKLCDTFEKTGACPYQQRCMFAHGADELRTQAENIADDITTEDAVKVFQRARAIAARSARKKRERRKRHALRKHMALAAATAGAEAMTDASSAETESTGVSEDAPDELMRIPPAIATPLHLRDAKQSHQHHHHHSQLHQQCGSFSASQYLPGAEMPSTYAANVISPASHLWCIPTPDDDGSVARPCSNCEVTPSNRQSRRLDEMIEPAVVLPQPACEPRLSESSANAVTTATTYTHHPYSPKGWQPVAQGPNPAGDGSGSHESNMTVGEIWLARLFTPQQQQPLQQPEQPRRCIKRHDPYTSVATPWMPRAPGQPPAGTSRRLGGPL